MISKHPFVWVHNSTPQVFIHILYFLFQIRIKFYFYFSNQMKLKIQIKNSNGKFYINPYQANVPIRFHTSAPLQSPQYLWNDVLESATLMLLCLCKQVVQQILIWTVVRNGSVKNTLNFRSDFPKSNLKFHLTDIM